MVSRSSQSEKYIKQMKNRKAMAINKVTIRQMEPEDKLYITNEFKQSYQNNNKPYEFIL